MKLTLLRNQYTDKSTIGELYIDGTFFCYTLEDVVRYFKIPGKTAIECGCYGVQLTMSNRFKEVMPILLDVPNYTGIRIHRGNTDKDTEGCILVGLNKGYNIIYKSKDAFDDLMEVLNSGEDIHIEIVDTIDIPVGV